MKKSAVVVGVVVVLGVAYVGSSWYVGKRAEDVVHNAVANGNTRLEQLLGPGDTGAKLTIDSYKRGVFSSDAIYTLTVKGEHGKNTEIKVADHIEHGPFPLAGLKKGRFQPVMVISQARLLPSAGTQKWFDARPDKAHAPVWALTTLGFSGTGKSVWHFQPHKVADGQVTFSGGTATVDLSNDYRDSNLVAAFDELGLKDGSDSLRARNVKIDGKTTTAASGAITTHTDARVGSFSENTADGPSVAIDDWRFTLDGTRAGDMVNGAAHYQIGHIQSGPMDLGSLALTAKVANLNVKALNALNDIYAQAGKSKASPDDQNKLVEERIMAVLADNPEISIENVQWKTSKGESTAKVELHLVKPDQAAPGDAYQAVLKALKVVNVDISLSRPMVVALMESGSSNADAATSQGLANAIVNQFSARLTQSGLARQNGDNLVSSIHYADGQVDLNGQKMSVNEFMMHASMLMMM